MKIISSIMPVLAILCLSLVFMPELSLAIYPPDGATDVPQPITFQWEQGNGVMFEFWSDYTGSTITSQASYGPLMFPIGTHSWRIRAYYWNGSQYVWSDWSPTWTFTCICATPDQAPILTNPVNGATDLSHNSITLKWEDMPFTAIEHIQVDDNSDFSSNEFETSQPSVDSVFITNLDKGTEYYWRVEWAYIEGCDYSDWSEVWSFTTDCPILEIPIQTLPDNEAVEQTLPLAFSWEAIGGTEYYYLQIDDDPAFNSPEVDDSMMTTNSAEITSGLNQGETYYWRVQAGDLCGWSGWSPIWSFEMACPLPEIANLISPADMATDVPRPVLLDWDDVTAAITYHIQVDQDPGFGSPDIDEQFSPGQSEYLAEGLLHETLYYWRVRVENECGWGNWGSSWQFTTICPSPDIPVLTGPYDGATGCSNPTMLIWDAVSEAEMYRIQIADNPEMTTPFVDGQLNWTSVYAPNLIENSTYYWRVKALNYCNWSEWSLTCEFTTGADDVCGDVNLDNTVNLLDITYTIIYLYKDGPAPCQSPSIEK